MKCEEWHATNARITLENQEAKTARIKNPVIAIPDFLIKKNGYNVWDLATLTDSNLL